MVIYFLSLVIRAAQRAQASAGLRQLTLQPLTAAHTFAFEQTALVGPFRSSTLATSRVVGGTTWTIRLILVFEETHSFSDIVATR